MVNSLQKFNDDLQIYHSPNDSYIDNTSGSLYIRGANGNHIRIQARSGEERVLLPQQMAQ